MNGYIRAILTIPYAYIKLGVIKLFHMKSVSFGKLPRVSLGTEFSIDKGSRIAIGDMFNMRGTARIRVRNQGELVIGNNVSLNINNMIACHSRIVIGDDVQFSPNVQIYDHDHDFYVEGGVKAGKYKVAPVKIGNNVWIGANTVILRGTEIGDNCVVGAGSVIKGTYSDNTLIIQKREEVEKRIEYN